MVVRLLVVFADDAVGRPLDDVNGVGLEVGPGHVLDHHRLSLHQLVLEQVLEHRRLDF